MRERIGIFGGSFDPVHEGHLFIATEARRQAQLERVLFVPCHQSPHKSVAPAASHHRVAMLELALQSLKWAEISRIELDRPSPSYAYLSVQQLQVNHPNADFYWLMGEDQWRALPSWKESAWLAEQLHFIVFTRDATPEPRTGYRMQALDGIHPASSTAIRAHNDNAPWLSPAVADYIVRHRLYL